MTTSAPARPGRRRGCLDPAQRAADRALGLARERLNLALDQLGDRLPDSRDLAHLVRLASEAFVPQSAAARLLRVLVLSRAAR